MAKRLKLSKEASTLLSDVEGTESPSSLYSSDSNSLGLDSQESPDGKSRSMYILCWHIGASKYIRYTSFRFSLL